MTDENGRYAMAALYARCLRQDRDDLLTAAVRLVAAGYPLALVARTVSGFDARFLVTQP